MGQFLLELRQKKWIDDTAEETKIISLGKVTQIEDGQYFYVEYEVWWSDEKIGTKFVQINAPIIFMKDHDLNKSATRKLKLQVHHDPKTS